MKQTTPLNFFDKTKGLICPMIPPWEKDMKRAHAKSLFL